MEKPNEKFTDFWEYIEKQKPLIEKSLREHLPIAPPKIETEFNEVIKYALFSGGAKRLRPVLTLLGAELLGGKAEDVLPTAAAVEFIYTSSRIFDDLPWMNATENGKLSLNSKFGEGLAIRTALGLLNASYPLVFVRHIGMPERAMQAHAEIVECVASSGLVGGQTLDPASAESVGSEEFDADDSERETVRDLRTSALMRLALRVGAILAGADYLDLSNLSRFAELLGDAYQLSDNLFDLEDGSETSLGDDSEKTSAIKQGKESAQDRLDNLVEEAKGILFENFPSNEARSCLIQLTEYLAEGTA